MFNMIKLDWLGMKYYWVRVIIIPVVICLMGFYSAALLFPIIAFMMLAFSTNPFAVEEKGKLDNLYLTLPVTRRNIVDARFGLSLIMLLAGVILGVIATILFSELLYGKTLAITYTFKADFKIMLTLISSGLLSYAILNLFTFPVLFKIGYAKGRALGYYVPMGIVSALIFTVYMLWTANEAFKTLMLNTIEWVTDNSILTAVIMSVAAVAVLAVSYMLSQKLYAKREF